MQYILGLSACQQSTTIVWGVTGWESFSIKGKLTDQSSFSWHNLFHNPCGPLPKTTPQHIKGVPDTHGVAAGHVYASRHAGIEESGILKIAISSVSHGAHSNLKEHGRGGGEGAMIISFTR